jgi:hypothetical protein
MSNYFVSCRRCGFDEFKSIKNGQSVKNGLPLRDLHSRLASQPWALTLRQIAAEIED